MCVRAFVVPFVITLKPPGGAMWFPGLPPGVEWAVAAPPLRGDVSGTRVDEVLEVGTFVRWCGPVEPFPDAGRFDEPRGGGGPVACG